MDRTGSEDAGPAPQNERSRADKKRHTDRVAQQRHRQRQRNYIAELEAQLLLLKEGSSGQITQLIEENAQLRQEVGAPFPVALASSALAATGHMKIPFRALLTRRIHPAGPDQCPSRRPGRGSWPKEDPGVRFGGHRSKAPCRFEQTSLSIGERRGHVGQ